MNWSSHCSLVKTYSNGQGINYLWPAMKNDLKMVIDKSEVCQSSCPSLLVDAFVTTTSKEPMAHDTVDRFGNSHLWLPYLFISVVIIQWWWGWNLSCPKICDSTVEIPVQTRLGIHGFFDLDSCPQVLQTVCETSVWTMGSGMRFHRLKSPMWTCGSQHEEHQWPHRQID